MEVLRSLQSCVLPFSVPPCLEAAACLSSHRTISRVSVTFHLSRLKYTRAHPAGEASVASRATVATQGAGWLGARSQRRRQGRCVVWWNKVGTGALGRRTGLWAGRYVPIWTYRATMTQQPGAERSRATASRIWLQAQQPTILDAPLIPLISSSPWANRRANSPQSSSQISRNTPTVRVLRPASPDTHKTCPPVDKRELQQWCVTRLRPRSR